MIIQIIKLISTAVVSVFSRYNERKSEEHKTDIAVEKMRQQRLELEIQSENQLNIERLKSTGKWFKYLTFIIWFGPFILSWIMPEYAAKIFNNMQILPEWYTQSCMLIIFTVWGIAVSRDTVQQMFKGLASFMRERREYKLKRKALYEIARKKGPLSQEFVNKVEPILDEIENDIRRKDS